MSSGPVQDDLRQRADSLPPALNDPNLESRLEAAIDPWLTHMRWRSDFDAWRRRRIRQEEYQQDGLADVSRALGGNVAGSTVLDLGCGMGGLSVALLREHEAAGLRLQAMDFNPAYCEITRLRAKRYGLSVDLCVAAGEQLPYPALQFDLVLCLDVLEHVADAERVVAEMFRVLKPGGTVLTTVPNRRAFRDPHYHLAFINWLPRPLAGFLIERVGRSKSGGLLKDRQDHAALNTYTWRELRRVARRYGFGVRDRVHDRIVSGEIRQLTGWKRMVLNLLLKSGLFGPVYDLYRYGWQGTYQVRLVKPR